MDRRTDGQTRRLGGGGPRGLAGCPDTRGGKCSVKEEGQSAAFLPTVQMPSLAVSSHQLCATFTAGGPGVGVLVASGCQGAEASPFSSWARAAACAEKG